jgi:hypothetical protein
MRTSVSNIKTPTRRPNDRRAVVTRSNARSRRLPNIGVTQERAERAIGIIIEAIQETAFALDAASLAIMYYIPAKGAEPKEALLRLDRVKERFGRALYLIDKVGRPPSKKLKSLLAQIAAAEPPRQRR